MLSPDIVKVLLAPAPLAKKLVPVAEVTVI